MRSSDLKSVPILAIFAIVSAFFYIVLLHHLAEYQVFVLPIANTLALGLQVPAQLHVRSEHIVVTVHHLGAVQSFQLDGLSWIYAGQASCAGLMASARATWKQKLCAYLIACLVIALIHATLLFFIAVDYVYRLHGLLPFMAFVGQGFYKIYANGTPVFLFLAWLYVSRRDITIVFLNLISKNSRLCQRNRMDDAKPIPTRPITPPATTPIG